LYGPAKEILSEFGIVEVSADDETLAKCDLLLSFPQNLDLALVKKMKRLRAIQVLSAGVDGIDFAEIPRNVKVFSNVGGYTKPVAEQAWALILGVAKGVNLRKRKTPPRLLRGGTLLVVGCGAIGSEVARIGRAAFEMKTIGVSLAFSSPESFDERHSPQELKSVIDRADVILDALPSSIETRSFLDYDVLRLAKPTVILVNVGRGETVDEDSIIRLLAERPEMRFGTDVFWKKDGKEEFESPLWDFENFAGTLHSAVLGRDDAMAEAQVMAAENARRFLSTGSALNQVDVEDYMNP
jgi:D-3-phosphoglycerate dehydrogenase